MGKAYMISLCSMLIVVNILVTTIPYADGANILLLPMNLKSHYAYFGPLAISLQNEGHNITIGASSQIVIPSNLAVRGIKTLSYNSSEDLSGLEKPMYIAAMKTVFEGGISNKIGLFKMFVRMGELDAADSLEDETFMQHAQEANFDIAVVEPFGPGFVLPYKLGIPSIGFAVDCAPVLYRVPDLPSYVPQMMIGYSDRMNFKQRFFNFLVFMVLNSAFANFGQDALVRKYVPERPVVTYSELGARAALFFRLRNHVIDYVRPSMPNLIDIPEIVARPGKPIPKDILQQIGEKDTIVVSFGSWIDVSLPEHVGLKLFEVFSQIKYTVLWKYTGKIPAKYSPNVKIHSWLPQNDILANEHIKLFITHAGFSSMLEAVSHGVPMIFFPFVGDQAYNAAIGVSKGYGIMMQITDFTVDDLVKAIDTVIKNQDYSENVKLAATFLKHPPIPAGKKASYWINHVVKYGVRHIRSAAFDLSLPQYYMLDIVGTLLIILIISCVMGFYIFRLFLRICKRGVQAIFVRKTKTE